MKLISLLLFFVFAGFVYTVTDQYPHGIVGLTLLNGGDGCVCHTLSPASGVNVSIKGPDSLAQGSSAIYTITIKGGSQGAGGFNVAARFGLLSVSDTSAKKIDVELTHVRPKVFSGDSVRWSFMYTAPAGVTSDTIYSLGLSSDNNGIPSAGDVWNFGSNFPVRILAAVPVELSSFNGMVTTDGVLLKWSTVTETNNKGYFIERKQTGESGWQNIGFVAGAGTASDIQTYQFVDRAPLSGAVQYRLKQTDYNGSYRYYEGVTVNGESRIDGFQIMSSYPNPFNPSTSLEFTFGSGGMLAVDIYSANGELVESLGTKAVESGLYRTSWNALNASPGIYFARGVFTPQQGKTESSVIKLVLLK